MDSIGSECNELKNKYDQCFNQWFSERFLKGDTDDSVCSPVFKVYQQCVKEALCTNQIEMKDLEGTHIDDKGYNSQSSSKANDKNKGKETKS
ncbi:unnamed protein product [Diamesa tonsa]